MLFGIKVLLLIIASDNEPRYIELQKLWKTYMHSDPEHIESYFIRGDPDLKVPFQIVGDVIWSRVKESVIPGIIKKTVHSLECLAPRLHEFDFVIRTNLSSLYRFPQLLEFLETLPKTHWYGGPKVWEGGTAASGCGIIWSSDLAELIVKEKESCLLLAKSDYDDMVLSRFLARFRIFPIYTDLYLITNLETLEEVREKIPSHGFHFRVGYPDPYRELLKMFYGRMDSR